MYSRVKLNRNTCSLDQYFLCLKVKYPVSDMSVLYDFRAPTYIHVDLWKRHLHSNSSLYTNPSRYVY